MVRTQARRRPSGRARLPRDLLTWLHTAPPPRAIAASARWLAAAVAAAGAPRLAPTGRGASSGVWGMARLGYCGGLRLGSSCGHERDIRSCGAAQEQRRHALFWIGMWCGSALSAPCNPIVLQGPRRAEGRRRRRYAGVIAQAAGLLWRQAKALGVCRTPAEERDAKQCFPHACGCACAHGHGAAW